MVVENTFVRLKRLQDENKWMVSKIKELKGLEDENEMLVRKIKELKEKNKLIVICSNVVFYVLGYITARKLCFFCVKTN